MNTPEYRCALQVRDYELDLQGRVNHSVYVNYLEHARSCCVQKFGINVWDYHQQGYDFVVVSLAQQYKFSLQHGDKFYVTANLSRDGRLKMVFDQEIRRAIDDKLMLTAQVVLVCLDNKRRLPCMPPMLEQALKLVGATDAIVAQVSY